MVCDRRTSGKSCPDFGNRTLEVESCDQPRACCGVSETLYYPCTLAPSRIADVIDTVEDLGELGFARNRLSRCAPRRRDLPSVRWNFQSPMWQPTGFINPATPLAICFESGI